MTSLNGKITLRHMEYSFLKSLHRELHHLLRPLITHAKKVQHHQREDTENSQNGLGPFLQAVRGSACAFAGVQRKRKTRGLGDTDIQKLIFSQRSFRRHSYFINWRLRRHRLSLYDFIMGRWETPPRVPPGLSYSGGGGSPSIPLFKPQSGGYSSATPHPFLAAYPPRSVKALLTHQPRR